MRQFKKSLLLAILFSMFFNALTINAVAGCIFKVEFASGYQQSQGHVEMWSNSTNDWVKVEDEKVFDPELESIKIRIVEENGWLLNLKNMRGPLLDAGAVVEDFSGKSGDIITKLTSEGYEVSLFNIDPGDTVTLSRISFIKPDHDVTGDVSISIEAENIEYWVADIPSRITFRLPGTNDIEIGQNNLVWKDGLLPPNATGVSSLNPVEVSYRYDDSNEVLFSYSISNANTKITSLIINDVDYTSYCPQSDQEILDNISEGGRDTKPISFYVTYADEYVIKVKAEPHDLMGGFGWNYLPEQSQSGVREDCIAHGTLSFVSGSYNGVTYDTVEKWNNASNLLDWQDGDKYYTNEADAWGSATFPKGATITMKLTPDKGYQLISLYGDENVVPQDETGVYKITMKGGMNSHLMATFKETADVVNSSAASFNTGSISNVENAEGIGTMRLDVADINSQGDKDIFDEYADKNNSEVLEYLDITLFNTVFKANSDSDTWDKQINKLSKPASITLNTEQDYSTDGNIYIIHDHEGTLTQIPVDYNPESKTLTFETDSFSNYALASTSNPTITVKTDGNGKAVPDSVTMNPGDQQFIEISPNDGYVFDYVEAKGINEGEEGESYSVLYSGWPDVAILVNKMPNNNVEFDVHFAPAVKVTIDPNGGITGSEFRPERIVKKGQKEVAPFEIWDEFLLPPEGKQLDYVEINGTPFDPSSDYTFNEDITVRYVWSDPSKVEYRISNLDNTAEMIFKDDKDQDYMLMVFDLLNLSDEDYQILDIDKKEADEMINAAKDKLNNYKEVLSIYLAELVNLNDDHYPEGPVRLRIKVNSGVNDYENLRIIDCKDLFDTDTFNPEIVKGTSVKDGYIEIYLPELRYNIWALSGVKKSQGYTIPTTGIQ